MPIASTSATQRFEQDPSHRVARPPLAACALPRRAVARRSRCCAAASPRRRRRRPSRRRRRPPRRRCAPHAITPVAWTALPGWSDDRVEERGPRFVPAARRSSLRRRARRCGSRRARRRRDVDGRSAARGARVLRSPFYPIPGRGRRRPRHRPHHRLLRAAARRQPRTQVRARTRCRSTRCPTICSIVDLTELYPELKGKRVRGRVEGRRVVPYWPRADIERGQARRSTARRSSTSTIRSRRSSCRSRARAASSSTTAA